MTKNSREVRIGIMKNKIIYIRRDDDLASVVEKIILSKEKEIILVFPREANLAGHKINFQILKREAGYVGKELFIDTESETVRRFCKDEGIELADDYSELLGDKKEKEVPVADIIAPRERTFSERKKEAGREPVAENERETEEEKSGEEEEEEEREEAPDFWGMLERKRLKKREEDEFSPILAKGSGGESAEEGNVSDFSKEFVEVRESRRWHYIIGLSSLVFLAIASYVAAFVLPRAEIVINAQKNEKEVAFSLTVDSGARQVEPKNYVIPGKILTFERTARNNFPATGAKKVENKASGIVRIYNAYSSKRQILVATTRFLSSSGKLFRIPRRIVIPGAEIVQGKIVPSYIDTRIYADKAGESYNIKPDKFTIPGFKGSPKYYGFYAQSFEPMKGGEVKEIKVVSKGDLEKAKNEVKNQLVFLLKKEFEEKTPDGYYNAENNWVLTKEVIKANAREGEVKDSFIVDADFVLKGAIFKKDDLYSLARGIFGGLPEAKDWNIKGMGFKFSEPAFDAKSGKLVLASNVDFSLIKKVDSQEIRKEVLNRKAMDVKQVLLSRPEIESAKIILWPFWVSKIPKNSGKVKVTIK